MCISNMFTTRTRTIGAVPHMTNIMQTEHTRKNRANFTRISIHNLIAFICRRVCEFRMCAFKTITSALFFLYSSGTHEHMRLNQRAWIFIEFKMMTSHRCNDMKPASFWIKYWRGPGRRVGRERGRSLRFKRQESNKRYLTWDEQVYNCVKNKK